MSIADFSTSGLFDSCFFLFNHLRIIILVSAILLLIYASFAPALPKLMTLGEVNNGFANFGRFFYNCFLKPYDGDETGGQQAALESFYRAQVRYEIFGRASKLTTRVGDRRTSTMLRARGSCVGEKICLDW